MGARVAGMLSVGEVARQAGLTPKALRHYDQLGLLVPASVSHDGYRWYDQAQVGVARTIACLRALDVPLDAVRAIVAGSDEEHVRRLLERHRCVLQARDDRIRRALHTLDHMLSDQRGVTMPLKPSINEASVDERKLAAALFNDTWALLAKEERTASEDDRMIHMAHASRFHWDNVGDDQNRAVGEWQCARVYSSLGRAEPALFHATRCLEYATRHGVAGWLVASAHEGLARAHAVAGDLETARDLRARALALAEKITDDEDRAIVLGDIDTLPIP